MTWGGAEDGALTSERGDGDPRDLILAMIAARSESQTLCPSEVARAMAASTIPPTDDWRGEMAAVHAAVDMLNREGRVALSWKGHPMETRAGPYRIRRPDRPKPD